MNRVSRSLTALLFAAIPLFAQTSTPFIGLGDSLGEGCQSANAISASQQAGYLNLVATKMGVAFPLPLIQSSPIGLVGSANGRSRIDTSVVPADLAVSGATTGDVLNAVANTTPATETDLVLPPYYGISQAAIAAQVKPKVLYCWVGTDDLIDLVLNASDLNDPASATPIGTFTTNYRQLISLLQGTGSTVVLANIPDFTQIAFMFTNDDLTRYTGTNYHLPAGSLTTLPTMALLKLGVYDASVLQNPKYVLSASAVSSIQRRITAFNHIISETAATAGFPVVDIHTLFQQFITAPVTIDGVTLHTHFNGGTFSLDGVHPSNTGYGLIANEFITTMNAAYGTTVPVYSTSDLGAILSTDPFIDFTGNGKVNGRPRTGILETLAPLVGLSNGVRGAAAAKADPAIFMRAYFEAKDLPGGTPWTRDDVIKAVQEVFRGR